jgi:prephenate dehydratase
MLRAGFLGPAGTYSEVALRALLPDAEGVPLRSEREAILAVERGELDTAVVPIENALEGAVTGTLDALALETREAQVVAETIVPVQHCLIAKVGGDEVREVVSHPQALGQCRRFLGEHLPGVVEVAATSTAEAVRGLRGGTGQAAIGTRRAADLYDCAVLKAGIEDEPGNATRFVQVARGAITDPEADATTIVFHGGGDAAPGWLVRCLDEFARRGVNLSKIESRPRKVGLGHYLFVLDCAGAASAPDVAAAVEALRGHCASVRVLGSYRRAAPPS